MFTFGSKQDADDAPKEPPLPKPATVAWSQLVMGGKPTTNAKPVGEATLFDRCNTVVAGLQEGDAKDLVKALVFLTSRSDNI